MAEPGQQLLLRVALELAEIPLSFEEGLLDDVRAPPLAWRRGSRSSPAIRSRYPRQPSSNCPSASLQPARAWRINWIVWSSDCGIGTPPSAAVMQRVGTSPPP